jgi:hypothetical protein
MEACLDVRYFGLCSFQGDSKLLDDTLSFEILVVAIKTLTGGFQQFGFQGHGCAAQFLLLPIWKARGRLQVCIPVSP